MVACSVYVVLGLAVHISFARFSVARQCLFKIIGRQTPGSGVRVRVWRFFVCCERV